MTGRSGAAAGGRRRRWLRRGLAVVVLLPVLLFGLSNLWLATPPGRSFVAGRISRNCGLPVRVGAGWWLPWSGLVVQRIEIDRPPPLALAGAAPVLKVRRIKVEPHWRELGRGRLVVGKIVVEEPEVDLPVELLVHLASAGGVRAPQEEPAVVAATEPEPVVPAADPAAGAPGVAPVPGTPAGPSGSSEALVPVEKVALPDPSWLVVRGGSFRVGRAAGGEAWVSLGGIDARVPLRGREADGSVAVAEVLLAGQPIGPQQVPLRWESPRLSVNDWQPGVGPLRLEVRAQCVLFASLPFVVECRLPEQAVEAEAGGVVAGVSAAKIGGAVVLGGHLRLPSTLAGQGRIEAENVTMSDVSVGGWSLEFDHCRAWGKVAGGTLRLVDARAVGDSLSLLGNAVVVADGRVGGVLRVVVPEVAVGAMTTRFAGLLPQPPAGFRMMETPDRWMVDTTLGGTIGDEWVRVGDGPARPLAELQEAWRRLADDGVE